MSSRSASYSHTCSFLLPGGARTDSDILVPSPYPCLVELGRLGLVTIVGASREAVFDQAGRILAIACDGIAMPLSVSCTLFTASQAPIDERRDWLRLEGATDGWTIIVNAHVAFSPTGLNPHFPNLRRLAQPAQVAERK